MTRATPEHVQALPLDCREVWRALRNAAACTPDTACTLPALASRLGWRLPRVRDALTHPDLTPLLTPCPRGWHVRGLPEPAPDDQPAPTPEVWPAELRAAWAALTPAEHRLMVRARMQWRGWANPGMNPPKPPQRRPSLLPVTGLLYAQERAYRDWSACRGGEGAVTLNATGTRDAGKVSRHRVEELYEVLEQNPDGMTINELLEALPGVATHTLRKWVTHARQLGRARSFQVGRADVWVLEKQKEAI